MHNLELGLHDTSRALVIGLLVVLLLFIRKNTRGHICIFLSFRLGFLLFFVFLLRLCNVFLQLCLTLGHVHIVDELDVGLDPDCH